MFEVPFFVNFMFIIFPACALCAAAAYCRFASARIRGKDEGRRGR